MKPILYIIVPCYNEQEVLPQTAPMFLQKINQLVSEEKISDLHAPACGPSARS